MNKRTRQYLSLLIALIAYYVIHEGAHLVVALVMGVFKQIKFMGLGVQIDVYSGMMSQIQMGIFCIAGACATLVTAWLLVLSRRKICTSKSKLLKAVAYYVTIAMLFADPLYLTILCGFFGNGDMNGIALLIPEWAGRSIFGVIGIVHILVFMKMVLPTYKEAFKQI